VTVGQPTSGESLDRAVDAYRAATPGSAALHRKAAVRLPAGVTSNVKFFPPYPVYLSRAEGAHVFDVDGREYIDYCLAFGPLITGHGHPRVMAAIKAELGRAGTTILGAPCDLELRLADRLAALVPSAEMVRLTNSGTEATMHALRIARAATGRSRVIKFEGHYHGVHDHVLWNLDQALPPKPASDGIPRAIAEQTIVAPFGDLDAVRGAFEHDSDIAAVIVEPVSRGVIHPERSFLQGLRDETARHGAVLVFDEVVAWPRVGLGGAQALYGVTPDLTTLGKAIGGGLPLGALVGRRDLMALTAPRAGRSDADAARPYVFHSGTYNGTPVALAAGLATLNLLEEPGVLEKLDALAESLREGLREIGRRRAIPLSVVGTGSVADFYFTSSPVLSSRDVWSSDLVRRRAIDYRLLAAGVYNVPVHRYHLSLAHTPGDIATTLDLIDRAIDA
jgi:glutamate-1-semialdehyde 2,1-aminomutase